MKSIRENYDEFGVSEYYSKFGESYENPHHSNIIECINNIWNPEWKSVIDFASGNGLITKIIESNVTSIIGCDKYLYERYTIETGKHCLPFSFEEVADFKEVLPTSDVIVFSYGIDLVSDSYLNKLLYSFSLYTKNLIVIRPNNHKLETYIWKVYNEFRSHKSRAVHYKTIDI